MDNTKIREMTPEERNRATVRYMENRMTEEVKEITLADVVKNQEVIVQNQKILDAKLSMLVSVFNFKQPEEVQEASSQEE